MKKWHLIVLEGIDGPGKDTQAKLIQKEYGGVITRLPFYENISWKAILEANLKMKKWISEEAYQTLMAANYIEHLDSFILKHINAGENVIMTRFTPSMIAYGRYFNINEPALNCLLALVWWLFKSSIWMSNIHSIYLRIWVKDSLKRIKERDKETNQKIQPLFEKEEILSSVKMEYDKLIYSLETYANRNIDEVFADIKDYLDNNM